MEVKIMKSIRDVTKKRITKAIVLVDKSLTAENKSNYKNFIKLYNTFTKGKNVYKVDWKTDYYVVNMKDVKQLMNTIDDISEKIKPSQVLFLSKTIYEDILKHYDNAAPYLTLMARASNRMIVVSNLLEEMYELNH